MMKYFAILGLCAVAYTGCTGKVQPVQQNSNTASEPQRAEKLQSVTAHTTENQPPRPLDANVNAESGRSKWSQSGDPIDTAQFDAGIAQAENAHKAKPADETAKMSLAQAYFDRGLALTQARQYASALGDYRKALKLDPNHAESKKWIDQIIRIYGMLKKDYPKEGEEPPPLPFKQD